MENSTQLRSLSIGLLPWVASALKILFLFVRRDFFEIFLVLSLLILSDFLGTGNDDFLLQLYILIAFLPFF